MRDISYYQDYISDELLSFLTKQAKPISQIPGLKEIGKHGGLESIEAFSFLCALYDELKVPLNVVLTQRRLDREFIDSRTKLAFDLNRSLKIDYLDPRYESVLGQKDSKGRVVVGHLNEFYCKRGSGKQIAVLPKYLLGNHVTLFGPPDDPKLSINAMNAFHRRLKNEPALIAELLKDTIQVPKWGADDEDSKTPLREDLIRAGENLTNCFDRSIAFLDSSSKKAYKLEDKNLALPIKRFPGLALPCSFLLYKDQPLPLHLYDFALHLFENWHNPEALSFYVPKLETTEEAAYIRMMVQTAERMIQAKHPSYKLESIRLFVVLENPRLIFRVNELMDELYPYFAGASLGWHDYLASTARLFKEDANYRIPVKADPNIVIKYIKASHELLAEVVGSRGGIKIGGMYGILPIDNDISSESFQLTIRGYIKDVVTQMKRDLSGFWVAHPDFVRLGMAIVEAWKIHLKGDPSKLENLVTSLLHERFHKEILSFIREPDLVGLDKSSPLYPRSLIVADMKESTFIANHHPDEIRYNVFQSLQYLTDWLSGNGCVALPAQIENVPVRVMDDLATAERSRWEVWHEIHHQRFSVEEFLCIAAEEYLFIRKDLSNTKKIVQVKWDDRTDKWYPVALRLMVQLMTSKKPVEFATELLLPFTNPTIRNSKDPWQEIQAIDVRKYKMDSYIEQFLLYFSICGSIRFAQNMARQVFCDLEFAQQLVDSFDLSEVKKAAYFHGDIGESKNTLDELAANEQKLVHQADQVTITELKTLGSQYLKKFGVKFLISAKDKSASQLLQILKIRIQNSPEQELQNAKEALWEISLKRLKDHVPKQLSEIEAMLKKHHVVGAQIALSSLMYKSQSLNFGYADKLEKSSISSHTYFELASLSKSVASCFAIEFFKEKNISLNTSVNSLFKKTKSQFRIQSLDTSHPEWADRVSIQHLMEHTALNMHYVNGIPLSQQMPSLVELLSKNNQFGYAEVGVTREPGKEFRYSGGGFLVLEHLIESLSNQRIKQLTDAFFKKLEITDLNFDQKLKHEHCAVGYAADDTEIVDTRKMFPAFAAGCMGTSSGVMKFLTQLTKAYNEVSKTNPISHSTARKMLFGQDKSSSAFMGAAMGLGVFTIEAGQNRFALHQGANDGFRALFLYCFSGPDSGKGFTIFCNSDQNAVVFICEVAQLLIRHLNFSGVNFALFESQFANTSVPAEEQVNQAYKTMIFNAFEPVLPEKIEGRTRVNKLLSLSLALDAEIVAVSNQRFARAENLFSKFEPVFDPELYGNQGKIMDSWESVRHNQLPADFIVFDLKQASVIKYVLISTQFHLGNQAPSVQIEAYDEVSKTWVEILEETKLEGHALKCLILKSKAVQFRRFKVLQFPDGGLTRLGLFSDLPEGEKSIFKDSNLASSQIYSDEIPKPHKPLTPSYEVSEELVKKNFERLNANEEFNISNLAYGAKIVSASNEHYSPAVQIISPYLPLNMFDGFESARSRQKNHFEEAVFSFFKPCRIHRYEIDFTFFKNNNPFEMSIEGLVNDRWMTILEPTNVKAFAGSVFDGELVSQEYFQQIRLKIIPDGGVNRVRFFTRKSALIEVAIL